MSLTVTDLLSRGYFPKEVVPLFTSQDYGKVADTLTATYVDKTWTAPAEFNLAKGGSLRRRLSIPHPFAQRALARICSANWTQLEAHVAQSNISLTRPVIDPTGRALQFNAPYASRSFENLRRLGRARYTVTADISDYYGSIYTHSIEWALHSKAVAKSNLRNGANRKSPSLGAQLDRAVGNCQEGQTTGIAISPDTSLLLSEIVMCTLDAELERCLPGTSSRCIRFMDDLMFAARSRAEAEDFLSLWETILGRFHLALNPRKTRIFDGPPPPESPWHVELLQFRIRQTPERATTGDIYGLASKALTLARQYPDEAILSYAVKKIHPKHLKNTSWNAFQDLLYTAAVAEPASIDKVVNVLATAGTCGQGVDLDRASEVFNEICEHHAPLERGHQVTWAMAILHALGLPLTELAAERISQMQDNSSLIMLFHFIQLGRIDGNVPSMTSAVARAENSDAHVSEDWLLGYECARNGWTRPGSFQTQAHWNEILKADIAFFNPHIGKTSTSRPSAPPPGTSSPSTAAESTVVPQPQQDESAPDGDSTPDDALDALTVDEGVGMGTRYP